MDIHTWFVDKSTTLKKICLHTRIDIACLHTVKWFQLLPTLIILLILFFCGTQ